eukprot:4640650-Amphidinium_carterae.1
MHLFGRVLLRREAFLEGPAFLPPQVREIEFPTHFARLPVAVQAPGKGVEGDDTPAWSLNMRHLR